jgi:ketosteroid isomerase-like protein
MRDLRCRLEVSDKGEASKMRAIHAAIVAFLVGAAAPAFAADAKKDVTDAYAAWDAAFNKQDTKALGATYAANAELLPPTHTVVKGREEIEKVFAGFFANGVTDHKLQLIDAGGDDKVMFGTANWSAKGKGKDGSPQNLGGLATHIFERQSDGSLKLRVHTFN